jgi:hypothetical protein
MGYSWGIRGVFMGYTYVSVMCRLCIGYVSVMCRLCVGISSAHLGRETIEKKEGRQQRQQFRGTNIVPRQEGNNITTKIADY